MINPDFNKILNTINDISSNKITFSEQKQLDGAINDLAKISFKQLTNEQRVDLRLALNNLLNSKKESEDAEHGPSSSGKQGREGRIQPLLLQLDQIDAEESQISLSLRKEPEEKESAQRLDKHSLAAVKIQRAFRRHQMRKKVGDVREEPVNEANKQTPANKNTSPHGNKFQGIERVKACIAAHQELLPDVSVPEHFGITHERVFAFLERFAPDVLEKWRILGEQFESAEDSLAFLDERSEELKEIRTRIEDIFNAHYADFDENGLHIWLNDHQGSFLMVRSDGVEDSADSTNAGGNLSEHYVSPNPQELIPSCGRVVASSFGEKSLRNQIQSKTNPFKVIPQLSVVLHELKGESPLTQEQAATSGISQENTLNESRRNIPISGVVFTTEPDFSGNDARFAVTTISCGYGHGEGVVGSRGVNTDTVYITESSSQVREKIVLYQNNPKPKRLAPVNREGKVDLELVANPEGMTKKKALNPKMVDRLYKLSKIIEKKMGKPQDLELVIIGEKIYVVQMRDVVRESSKAQFLEIPEGAVSKSLEVQTLVSGKNPVVQIDHPDQVLTEMTLESALRKYNPALHKIILVSREETSKNSHPVVIARGLGIPCFYAPKKDINKILPSVQGDLTLVVDQSEDETRLLLWKKEIPLQDLLKPGYLSHPAPMSISLGQDFVRKNAIYKHEMPPDLKHLIRSLKTAQTTEVAVDVLSRLQERALVPLQARIKKLEEMTGELETTPSIVKANIKVLHKLNKKITQAFAEIEAAYKQDSPPLAKLFHIKALSKLLSDSNEKTLNTFSLLDMESVTQQIERVLRYEEEAGTVGKAKFSELLYVGDYGFSDEERMEWEQFLLEQEQSATPEVVQDFKLMLQTLDQQNALSLWFKLIALPTIKNSPKEETLQTLLRDYQSNTAELQTLFELTSLVENMEANLLDFSDPKQFELVFQKLDTLAKKFNDPLPCTNQFTKIILARVLEQYATLFDEATKSMKGSPSFADEKVQLFYRMLNINFGTMEAWMKTTMHKALLTEHMGGVGEDDDDVQYQSERIAGDIKRYLHPLKKPWVAIEKNIAQGKRNPGHLNPSRGFNVSAAVFGSVQIGNAQNRHLPKTLEDFFTLIHQNQLAIVAMLLHSALPNEDWEAMNLPPLFKEVIQACDNGAGKATDRDSPLKRTGLKINKENMIVSYNLSLGLHAMKIDFELNRKGEVIIHTKFFGQRIDRWRNIAALAGALKKAGIFKVKNCSYTEQGVQFSLTLNTGNNMENLSAALEGMTSMANQGTLERALSTFNPETQAQIRQHLPS